MKKNARKPVLMKYTSLSSAIHILRSRALPLLDPSRWDDKNDGHVMRRYEEAMGRGPVRATCFTQSADTYHHWSVFAAGPDGVRLEIDKAKLLASLEGADAICGEMRYLTINELREPAAIAADQLAFVKRQPYADEREFRILRFAEGTPECPLALSWIRRVTLSPWMPPPVATSVKAALKAQPGCGRLRVYQSTLVGNADWRAAADKIAKR
ncbi:MAG: DUF2971 domain-containing protein [Pseudomonadota bacterium]